MITDLMELKKIRYSVQMMTGEGEKKSLNVYPAQVRQRFPDKTFVDHIMNFICVESAFLEPVEIHIRKLGNEGQSCVVRPLAKQIKAIKRDDEYIVVLSEPVNLSVEFDGDMYENLFIFSYKPDDNKTQLDDGNVLYFGPGEHEVGLIELKSNQTLYIDSDAVVYGRVYAKDAANITIKGHGILDGSKENHTDHRPYHVFFEDCCNIRLENIIVRDSPAWSIVPMRCQDVFVSGIKQISYNWNSDGFDICSCDNVEINNVFVRNFDDNISLKSFQVDCKNITFRDSVVWCDCAHNMLVGPEADLENGTIFENVSFKNITVLESSEYCETYMGVMAIMCANRAVIKNISWDNIVVERASISKLINFQYVTEYAKELGHLVDGVSVNNVVSYEKDLPMTILGVDEEHRIKNVSLKSIVYVDRQGDSSESLQINNFVDDITIVP